MIRLELAYRRDLVTAYATKLGCSFDEALARIETTDEGRAWAARRIEQPRLAIEDDERW